MNQITTRHIFWFAYYGLESPSVRYRGKFPLEYAKRELKIGHTFVVPGYAPRQLWRFASSYVRALVASRKSSIVVVQRVQSNFIYASLLRLLVRLRKDVIYDLDDADYLETKSNSLDYFIRNCKLISGGSEGICGHCSGVNPHVNHLTSPTVDLKIVKRVKNKTLHLGWIGNFGRGHDRSLFEQVFPALRSLGIKCELSIVGVKKDEDKMRIESYFKGHDNIALRMFDLDNWLDEAAVQSEIVKFDLGIATLEDTEFQRSKSGIKAKQYLNNGVPVLSTDLPENNRYVSHGVNGFLCRSHEDFSNAIEEVNEMSDEEYLKLSRNARNTIHHFSQEKFITDLLMMASTFPVSYPPSHQPTSGDR